MLENGLDITRIITHRFTVDEFEKGFEAMLSGKSGKVVSDWGWVGFRLLVDADSQRIGSIGIKIPHSDQGATARGQ